MATGALSSLGIGSNGTLSYDVIDQLKEADKNSMIKPIERNIVEVNEKQAALQTLKAGIASFEDSIEELSSTTLFANRDISINGDSVSATVSAGVDVQDMNIEVNKLAKKDVHESTATYSSETSAVATGDTTLDLEIDGLTYNFDVTATTSLEELKNMINEQAGDKVTASILNTGGSTPYKLIIKSDESGLDNALTLTDSNGTMNTSFNNIQAAQDAEFKYNGVDITRSSNTFDDLITGVSISLLKENDPGETTNIEITQDLSGLNEKMEGFVEQYNSLMRQLDELTKYDEDTGQSGLFLGESTINKLKSDLSSTLTYTTADSRSLQDYGITLQESGQIEYESTKLEEVLSGSQEGIDKMSQIFLGSYEEINGEERLIDGIFSQFSETVDSYTDFSTGIFKYFGEQLENESKALERERASSMERLDQKYQTMAERFAAYDSQISNMNSSFGALQMQIEQAANGS